MGARSAFAPIELRRTAAAANAQPRHRRVAVAEQERAFARLARFASVTTAATAAHGSRPRAGAFAEFVGITRLPPVSNSSRRSHVQSSSDASADYPSGGRRDERGAATEPRVAVALRREQTRRSASTGRAATRAMRMRCAPTPIRTPGTHAQSNAPISANVVSAFRYYATRCARV